MKELLLALLRKVARGCGDRADLRLMQRTQRPLDPPAMTDRRDAELLTQL